MARAHAGTFVEDWDPYPRTRVWAVSMIMAALMAAVGGPQLSGERQTCVSQLDTSTQACAYRSSRN